MTRQTQDLPLFGSLMEDKDAFVRSEGEFAVLENVATTTTGVLKKRQGYANHASETAADAGPVWVGATRQAAYTWLAVGVRGVVAGAALSAAPLLYSAPPLAVDGILRVDPEDTVASSASRLRSTSGFLLVSFDGYGTSSTSKQWIYATATGRVVRPAGTSAFDGEPNTTIQGWGGRFWGVVHPEGGNATVYRLNPADTAPTWSAVTTVIRSGLGRGTLIAGSDRIFYVNTVGASPVATGLAVLGLTSALSPTSALLTPVSTDSADAWGFYASADDRLVVGARSAAKSFKLNGATLSVVATASPSSWPGGDLQGSYDSSTSSLWVSDGLTLKVSASTLLVTSFQPPVQTELQDLLFVRDGRLFWATNTPRYTRYNSRDIVWTPTSAPAATPVWAQKLSLDAAVPSSAEIFPRGVSVSAGSSGMWVLSPEISRAAGEFKIREIVSTVVSFLPFSRRLPTSKEVKKQFTETSDIIGFGLQKVTFDPQRLPPPAPIGGDALVVGGAQSLLISPTGDAQLVQCPLEPKMAQLAGGSAATITSGSSYLFGLQYEIPVGGRLIRSVPFVTAIQASNSDAIRLAARTTGVVTMLGGLRPRVKFYRGDENGTVMYLQNETTISAGTTTISYSATNANVVLSTPVMRFSVGELPNTPTPPFRSIASGNRRVWGISSLNRSQLWPSKIVVDGAWVEWSDELVVDLSAFRILPEAVGILDDKAIVLGDGQLVVVFGEGPDNIGGGGAFGIQEIEAAAGCHNRHSVVGAAGAGLFYQSRAGIMLLDRQLQENNIGQAVEETIRGQTLHSPVHLTAQEEVRWVVGSTGTIIVYNYGTQAWSTYAFAASAVDSIRSATVLDQSHLLLAVNASGAARTALQTSGVYADLGDGEVIPRVVTPWYRPAGMQGHLTVCRLQLLGRRQGAHNLQVRVAYDYKDTYEQTFTFPDSLLSTIEPYQLELYPSRRRCQSFRLEITETVTSGQLTQGVELVAASVEMIPHGGLNRVPQANRR